MDDFWRRECDKFLGRHVLDFLASSIVWVILACRENQNNILVFGAFDCLCSRTLFSGSGVPFRVPGRNVWGGFFNLRTKNIYIVYSPKVVYVVSFVAMLVSIVFTSLAAPRRCHLAKIKCGKCPLVALVMGWIVVCWFVAIVRDILGLGWPSFGFKSSSSSKIFGRIP